MEVIKLEYVKKIEYVFDVSGALVVSPPAEKEKFGKCWCSCGGVVRLLEYLRRKPTDNGEVLIEVEAKIPHIVIEDKGGN